MACEVLWDGGCPFERLRTELIDSMPGVTFDGVSIPYTVGKMKIEEGRIVVECVLKPFINPSKLSGKLSLDEGGQ